MSTTRTVTPPAPTQPAADDAGYVIPWPQTPRERAAFTARHEDGGERVYHATGSPGGWEIDSEDWWFFGAGWTTTGTAQVTRPRRLVNPNPR